MNDKQSELINSALQLGAIAINDRQPFKYKSGVFSPIYFDMRILASNPETKILIGDMLYQKYHDTDPDYIMGVASGGVYPAEELASRMNLIHPWIKVDAKEHGKKAHIFGLNDEQLRVGGKAIIVEDVVTSGGSLIDAINIASESGFEVISPVCIYSHRLPRAAKAFESLGMEYHALIDKPMVMEAIKSCDYLSTETLESVLQWNHNPKEWDESYRLANPQHK